MNFFRRLSLGSSRKNECQTRNSSKDASYVDPTICSDDSYHSNYDGQRGEWKLQKADCRKVQFSTEITVYSCRWMVGENDVNSFHNAKENLSSTEPTAMVVSKEATWYSRTDIGRFKSEVEIYARLIQKRAKHQPQSSGAAWLQSLSTAYHSLPNARTIEKISIIMNKAPPSDPLHVGLEKWIPRDDAGQARLLQRRILYKIVTDAQGSGDVCSEKLRKSCRDASRPNILFAIYLAHCVTPSE